MKIEVLKSSLESVKDELLVIGLFQDEKLPSEVINLDKKSGNQISEVISSKDFKSELLQTSLIYLKNTSCSRILLVGLGKRKEYKLDNSRGLAGISTKAVKSLKKKAFSIYVDSQKHNSSYEDIAQSLAEGVILGNYDYDLFKTKDKKDKVELEKCSFITNKVLEVKQGSSIGYLLAETVSYVRDLINTPSMIKVPEYLAKQAESLAKRNHLKCTVFREKDIEKMGMNALLAVGKGSVSPPRLVVLEYGNQKQDTIVVVGKGITFDSGGLNLKPGDYMNTMKEDMSGAAAVFGILEVASKLKLPLHIIGIAACAENMPSGSAYRPGDIFRAYNGKSIEVANTDAEGRVVLADALSYTNKYEPKAIIDIATLTGACAVALGSGPTAPAGVFGTDEKLIRKLIDAGSKTHERLWQLPLWPEHSENVKSKVADVKNLGSPDRYGGAIAGAAFLKEFVDEKTPWAHLDIAGPAWADDQKQYFSFGGTGFGVRLIIQFLRDWKK
ncbi:leucyl aminopeptidase [Candidatus Woesearchaeota archaeon]|nr:leucyl aminopeptidase [Candidatus Woesearchaeota archaeon]